MIGRFFKRLFGPPRPPRFDAVFDGPDSDLVYDLIARIEGPRWRLEQLMALTTPEIHLVRLCRFDGIFGNGGLQYWFECDHEVCGRHMGESFRAVGLDDAAEAMDLVFEVFPTPLHYDDFQLRMAALSNLADDFAPLEQRLWLAHDEIAARVADFARRHKGAFEHLRHVRPWDSLREAFGHA
ncbi:MAG: DUF4375 domain-containing protein [Planctomycetota bacterium]